MKILFAVPYFKNAKFLNETLRSIQAQTDRDWACVVLDDSIDPKEEEAAARVLGSLADSRINLLRNDTNLGLAKNWNQAFLLARGYDLLTILHADDLLEATYLASMKSASLRHPAAAGFFCQTRIIDESGKSSFSFPDWYKTKLLPKAQGGDLILKGVQGAKTLIPGNFVFCPTMAFRPKVFEHMEFATHYRMVLDFDLILRILLAGETLVGLYQKPLYFYRRHRENQTQALTQSMVRFDEEIAIYDELGLKLKSLNENEASRLARQKKVVQLNLFFQVFKALLAFDFKGTRRYLKFVMQLRKKISHE